MSTTIDVTTAERHPPAVPLSEQGPAPKRIVATFGFWLFLLSDIIIFGALFAAYAVLGGETNGGPAGVDLFDKRHVLVETGCLLASSFTCGMMMIAVDRKSIATTYFWALVTFALGFGFLWL